ncbi:unnamed protein product [Urochloa humidicola]
MRGDETCGAGEAAWQKGGGGRGREQSQAGREQCGAGAEARQAARVASRQAAEAVCATHGDAMHESESQSTKSS